MNDHIHQLTAFVMQHSYDRSHVAARGKGLCLLAGVQIEDLAKLRQGGSVAMSIDQIDKVFPIRLRQRSKLANILLVLSFRTKCYRNNVGRPQPSDIDFYTSCDKGLIKRARIFARRKYDQLVFKVRNIAQTRTTLVVGNATLLLLASTSIMAMPPTDGVIRRNNNALTFVPSDAQIILGSMLADAPISSCRIAMILQIFLCTASSSSSNWRRPTKP